MEFVPVVMMLAFPVWLVDMVGYARKKDVDALVKNGLGLIGVFVAAWLLANTRWAGEINIGDGDTTLAGMSIAELIVVAFGGLSILSGGALRIVKAIDGSQSAKSPVLVPKNSPYEPGDPEKRVAALHAENAARTGLGHDPSPNPYGPPA